MRTIQLTSEGFEGEAIGTAAMLVDPTGAALTIPDVTSWDLRLYDETQRDAAKRQRPIYSELAVDPSSANTNGTPDSALIVSSTIRKDGYWKGGPDPGYNFLKVLTETEAAAHTPAFVQKGGHTYRLEFLLTTTWDQVTVIHRRRTVSLNSV
jgi:hypothetical protein